MDRNAVLASLDLAQIPATHPRERERERGESRAQAVPPRRFGSSTTAMNRSPMPSISRLA